MWKRVRRYMLITYLIFLHLLLGFVLVESNIIEKYALKYDWIKRPPQYYYNAKLARHLRKEYQLPDTIIVLLGDSITEALPTEKIANNLVNYGISRDDTVGVLKRVPLYAETFSKATAVFLAIGINDLHQNRSVADVMHTYQQIVQQLPADKPLILSAVLPIGLAREQQWQLQDQITVLNTQIAALAEQSPQWYFFNGATAMADAGGYLRESLHRGDGLHLNATGYSVWGGELASYLGEIGVL